MIKIRAATSKDLKEIAKLNYGLVRYESKLDTLVRTKNLQKELLKYNLKHLKEKNPRFLLQKKTKRLWAI